MRRSCGKGRCVPGDPLRADSTSLLKLHWQAATLLARLQSSGVAGTLTFNELRVIHALTTHEPATATKLCVVLCIDAGYLSRIVRRLTALRMVKPGARGRDADSRNKPLAATRSGRRALAHYERNVLQRLRGMATEE